MTDLELEAGSWEPSAAGTGMLGNASAPWRRWGELPLTSAIGRVIVPALDLNCVASLALRTERVPHEVTLVYGKYAYANLFAETWKGARGFIVVEHDVAPWPGALYQLWACGEPWCTFYYPTELGHLTGAMGCTKFGPDLMLEHPGAAEMFANKHWLELDGAVTSAAMDITGRTAAHVHSPAVAHARSRTYP